MVTVPLGRPVGRPKMDPLGRRGMHKTSRVTNAHHKRARLRLPERCYMWPFCGQERHTYIGSWPWPFVSSSSGLVERLGRHPRRWSSAWCTAVTTRTGDVQPRFGYAGFAAVRGPRFWGRDHSISFSWNRQITPDQKTESTNRMIRDVMGTPRSNQI